MRVAENRYTGKKKGLDKLLEQDRCNVFRFTLSTLINISVK